MALMRERKIVNAGDILRFELEGLSAALPPHKRVLGYDIWFEPLPRTTTQKLKRHEVLKRARERERSAAASRRAAAGRGSGLARRAACRGRGAAHPGARERRPACGPTRTSSWISASTRWNASSC